MDEAANHHPDEWWLIKANGCDLVPGLAESVCGTWSGDEDLNDGKLETKYEDYCSQLDMVDHLKLHEQNLPDKLESALTSLKDDLEFLHSGKDVL